MFLTRFHLDPRSRAGARSMGDPQRLHATIYAAMPTQPVVLGQSPGRPLWRLDRDEPAAPVLWIVSPEQPNLDDFAAEAGRIVAGVTYQCRPYEPLLNRLGAGQVYAFRLAANAVHSGRVSAESTDTQRLAHITAAQQLAWLTTRSTAHGFSVVKSAAGEPDAAVIGRRRLVFRRGEQRVTIAVSDFMGHLQVDEVEVFRRTLVDGIGHARAYGCGLLTLAVPNRR